MSDRLLVGIEWRVRVWFAPALPRRGRSTAASLANSDVPVAAGTPLPCASREALTLTAKNVAVDATYASGVLEAKPGNYVVLQVQDSGTGIPPEIVDRIFEPFFTTKGPEHGTGLGLSTVLGIVRSHGGIIGLYTEAGKGTAFKVYLPADTGAAAEPTAEASADFKANGLVVLLVDDEHGIREVAQAILQRLGFKVLVAEEGAEAIVQFTQAKDEIKLVLTDLAMPHMDGVTLIRALRRMAPHLKIIAMSGLHDEQRDYDLQALEVTALLDKPFNRTKLIEVLKQVLA